MHKRSIFSSRFDKERQTKDLQWLHAFNKSKLFPKISESSFRKPSHKPTTANKPIRKRLLNSNEWYDSDKISFTDRYFMEQRLNINLLEKSECESIAVLRSKDDVCDKIGNQSRRKSIKFHGTMQAIDKIKILENVLKIEVLEETLNEINIKNIMESPSKQSSIRISIISSDGKHVCFYCDKRFTRAWILSNHIQLHTGVKQFQCPKCNHAFADLSNLRAHQRSKGHHDWRFACTQCSKPFHNSKLLDRHTIHACRRYLKNSKKLM